jgi:hypothetical protein
MSQAAELSRVKGRIKALTDKTVANGCTEAEAMAAADMVGRLLERYALSMDEIEIRTARCVQVEVPLGGRRRRPIDACVPTIARFCDCKVWLARATAANSEQTDFDPARRWGRYVFFGFETDTALASYLFTVIDRAVSTETAAFKRLNQRWPDKFGQADKWSFCLRAARVPHIRSDNGKTSTSDAQSGLQGEGGTGCHQGREDAGRAGAAV